MKIVDQKGKLFGLINVVDLLIILMVVAVAAVVIAAFLGDNNSLVKSENEIEFTVRVSGAHPRKVAEIEKFELPLQLVAGTTYVEGAYVVDMKAEPYERTTTNSDGELIRFYDDQFKDMVFTIRATTDVSGPIIKVGTQEVRAGTGYTIKTKYFEYGSVIDTVDLGENG